MFLIAAMAAMSLTSCQKENIARDDSTTTLTVRASIAPLANATKTYIDDKQVYWDADEQMKVVNLDSKENIQYTSSTFQPSSDSKQGVFSFNVKETGETRYAGVYPASAANGMKNLGYRIDLLATQNATADSYDPEAYILVTAAETIDLSTAGEWEATYYRATALNNFQLSNLNDGIVSVAITLPSYKYEDAGGETIEVSPAGSRYYDLETGTPKSVYYAQSNVITVKYTEPLTASAKNIWFTSWGVELAPGDEITIEASSDSKIYTKTLNIKESRSLKEGWLNTVAIDMSDADVKNIGEIKGSLELTFPDDNRDDNKVGGYEQTWTAIADTYKFTIANFNNNNWSNWTYIRCGSKKNASLATITNKTALPKLKSIDITVDKATNSAENLNEVKLDVYKDYTGETPSELVTTIPYSGQVAKGTLTFDIPAGNQADNLHYQIVFDCKKASGNGIIQISKVTYNVAE